MSPISISTVLKSTLGPVLMNGSSNVVAQVVSAYKHGSPLIIDPIQLIRFMACTMITNPLMVLWQDQLEATFPGCSNSNSPSNLKSVAGKDKRVTSLAGNLDENYQPGSNAEEKSTQKLNIRNTVIKILIDQTLGAAWSSAAFIVIISVLHGQDTTAIKQSLMKAADYGTMFGMLQ
ncbi:uncharacterized protein PADG_04743 [Paracoccidioides brasiliensis Pb18]|uniref:Uncharacterized protein n=1 Tax=Paracoccidioides brasiliensis (strain Pb18) TaxID=502780 RepID=C1GCM1_PARBD|nr:uncharacterized protein PADG_04743 [Paracoccidioides brasiliensis Pb18]EEH48664.2 hypothetical protein PADG_04743 [Paracoccidioides brasiliensis Pb18]